ncbi:EamA family transporter [Candidatus Geothermarchaeota archaeon]|nr:MAG: EamA family transporter [Candidatus Geothermarchaeota archaeon]HEW93963.1 EamA family transporter [Thermoprotei archaeon]
MWLVYSLLTLLLWGVWGFSLKIVMEYVDWFQYYIYATIVPVILSILIAIIYRDYITINVKSFSLIILASLAGSVGYIFLVLALKYGHASIVVPMTALYPAVTSIIAYFVLKERLAMHQWAGLILAIIAVTLLSIESL